MKKLLLTIFSAILLLSPLTAFAATITTNNGTAGLQGFCNISTGGQFYGAQKFTMPAGGGTITSVSISLAHSSTFSQTLTIDLRADNSGVPGASTLATVNSASSNWPLYSGGITGFNSVTFSSSYTATAGTYWIVIYPDANTSTGSMVTGGAATPNEALYSDGSVGSTPSWTIGPENQIGMVITYTATVASIPTSIVGLVRAFFWGGN